VVVVTVAARAELAAPKPARATASATKSATDWRFTGGA